MLDTRQRCINQDRECRLTTIVQCSADTQRRAPVRREKAPSASKPQGGTSKRRSQQTHANVRKTIRRGDQEFYFDPQKVSPLLFVGEQLMLSACHLLCWAADVHAAAFGEVLCSRLGSKGMHLRCFPSWESPTCCAAGRPWWARHHDASLKSYISCCVPRLDWTGGLHGFCHWELFW